MSKQVGLDMKLYRNAGSYASPTWNAIDNVRDLTMPDSFGEADVSKRGAAIKLYARTLRTISIEFEMVYDETDTDFTTLQTAYTGKTLVEVALADGAIGTAGTTGSGGTAGSEYIRIDVKVAKFERNEALEGGNIYSVTLEPCYSTHNPSSVATVS